MSFEFELKYVMLIYVLMVDVYSIGVGGGFIVYVDDVGMF